MTGIKRKVRKAKHRRKEQKKGGAEGRGRGRVADGSGEPCTKEIMTVVSELITGKYSFSFM